MTGRTNGGGRLRYLFDKTMAGGPVALIGWLALLTLITIVVASVVIAATRLGPDDGMGFNEAMWQSLMRTMDPGAVAADEGWAFRLVTLLVTLFGILVFSALISVMSSGLDSTLDRLRKGRSQVLERNHTIILNWSPSIFDIISQLCIANASERGGGRIVVMADRDKVEMEAEIVAKVGSTGRTQVICRSGDPTDLFDLAITNPATCKSVIVVSPPQSANPDSDVIKTVLALTHAPDRRAERLRIAAELRHSRNMELARAVGGDETNLVLADELISRIIVHSSRQTGLSGVYSELLDFEGCEIYTAPAGDVKGRTFGAALSAFRDCTLIGIRDGAHKVLLNPASDVVIGEDDCLILIAEDDTAIRSRKAPDGAVNEAAILSDRAERRGVERALVLGWNRRGRMIVRELARYVQPGSVITMAGDAPGMREDLDDIHIPPSRATIDCRVMDTSDPAAMETLDPMSYDSIIVLGYSDIMTPQKADTRTLITLLHLRRISERAGKHVGIVSEMTDVRNRELAEVTRADDFVVSNKLVSLMLAQTSENENLATILGELLDEEGSEIYMRPIGKYADLTQPMSFYTLVESARRRGQVAIGYRRCQDTTTGPRKLGGVVINPDKANLVQFQPEDRLIVLSAN